MSGFPSWKYQENLENIRTAPMVTFVSRRSSASHSFTQLLAQTPKARSLRQCYYGSLRHWHMSVFNSVPLNPRSPSCRHISRLYIVSWMIARGNVVCWYVQVPPVSLPLHTREGTGRMSMYQFPGNPYSPETGLSRTVGKQTDT